MSSIKFQKVFAWHSLVFRTLYKLTLGLLMGQFDRPNCGEQIKPRLPAQWAVGTHRKGPSRMEKVTSRMN